MQATAHDASHKKVGHIRGHGVGWDGAKNALTVDIDLAGDVFLSNNPSRGGYRGMNVPGA